MGAMPLLEAKIGFIQQPRDRFWRPEWAIWVWNRKEFLGVGGGCGVVYLDFGNRLLQRKKHQKQTTTPTHKHLH